MKDEDWGLGIGVNPQSPSKSIKKSKINNFLYYLSQLKFF